MRKEFTLHQLQIFVAVAEELHFRRAAERLDMSQPPLTRQLRALEVALGAELFERTTRRVALTVAGKAFLEQAQLVLASVERARAVAEKAAKGQIGAFRVGYVEPVAFDILPRVLPNFRSAFPDVDLELHEMNSFDQVRQLHDKKIDVGILRPPIDQTGLEVELIGANRLVAVLWERHPLAADAIHLKDLAAEPFVTFAEAMGSGIYTAMLQACARTGFVPRIVHRATSTPMLLSLVAAREGVSLLSEQYALMPRPGVRFATLKGGTYTSPVAIAWRKGEDNAGYTFLRAQLKRAAARASPSARSSRDHLTQNPR